MLLASPWQPRLADSNGPASERLVEALARDIADGSLPSGARLPAHRPLAWQLDIGIGTVTKAYAQLERRGLVRSVRGRGMFVAGLSQAASRTIDLSINVPPQQLSDRLLAASLADLARRLDADSFGAYAVPAGRLEHRALLARWLAPTGLAAAPERLLICNGAQHALAIAFAITCSPDTELLTEALSYPGAIALARRRGLRLTGLAIDEQGLVPQALDKALHEAKTAGRRAVLYITPTLHNPTTATMSEARRRDIASLCRTHDAVIIEDDIHAALAESGTMAIAALAPERTLHVSGLSKVLSPGLRIGSLLVPELWLQPALAELAATCTMASLLSCLIMERWLSEDTAASVARSIREEAGRRVAMARELLPPGLAMRSGNGFHVWLPMAPQQAKGLPVRAAAAGILLPAPEIFLADTQAPSWGVRLSLGGPKLDRLQDALAGLRALLLDSGSGLQAPAMP
ncbi:PLP-dependent aminotransferase family protein [Bosea sp. (in: a-proteobacteria)]|jgi:DNA-binding transcriptional MocR family regulator|uniref:aminotransferase-like domain-containing protein n=1 Tax=Bosea sp. (in: a-proteobacteria) TaxID=1871050 RepID=UPI002DDCA6A0|nr:PLP-dependent aminotransferase family protein [Bosea sp. (in: a-proteobacteria)]HEV2512900.1 PLP-dependent aminotransferase family protein [Bosea sp. (in: a-proteobacteria)]